jgi:hypothetical protein
MVESHDDKHYTNDMLRKSGRFIRSRGWLLEDDDEDVDARLKLLDFRFPTLGQLARGRSSHDVKAFHTLEGSSGYDPRDYLAKEEATVTIIPPSDGKWSSLLRRHHRRECKLLRHNTLSIHHPGSNPTSPNVSKSPQSWSPWTR